MNTPVSQVPELRDINGWTTQSVGNLIVAVRPRCHADRSKIVTIVNLSDDPNTAVTHMTDLWNCGMLANACVQLKPSRGPFPTPCVKIGGNWIKTDIDKYMIAVNDPKAEKLITESGATLVFCNTEEKIPDPFYDLISKAIAKRNPIYVKLNMDIAATDSDTVCFERIYNMCVAAWGKETTSAMRQYYALDTLFLTLFPPEMVEKM